jgi:hypothetical protein
MVAYRTTVAMTAEEKSPTRWSVTAVMTRGASGLWSQWTPRTPRLDQRDDCCLGTPRLLTKAKVAAGLKHDKISKKKIKKIKANDGDKQGEQMTQMEATQVALL